MGVGSKQSGLRPRAGFACRPEPLEMQRYSGAARRTSGTFAAMLTPAQFVRSQGAVVH
jgi:hypothetical protein